MTDINDLSRRMEGAISTLQGEFSGLRTGRASTELLDHVRVDAYGSAMPINQLANVSAPEARLLVVNVWDAGLVKAVEKGIANADLGLNPAAEGATIRVPLPELSEERRKELAKVAGKYAENCRIAIRNVRRDGMEGLKKQEKNGEISEDEQRKKADDIQKLTDGFVGKVDDLYVTKEKDILSV